MQALFHILRKSLAFMNSKTVVCFCCLLLCCSCISHDVYPLFPSTKLLDNPYGVCSHITRRGVDWELRNKNFDICNMVRATYVRSDIDYYNPSTVKSSFYHKYDSVVNSLMKYNINLLGIISPPWRSTAWKDSANFHHYVYDFARRYGDKVHYWEFLNEINLTNKDHDILANRYTSSLKDCNEILKKQCNKECKILLSGLGELSDGFLKEICEKGAYKYFDIMNFHSYKKPEDLPKYFRYIKFCMDSYGWSKPVWITEAGMHTANIGNGNLSLEEEQAKRVARLFLISFAYGADKVFWYNLRSFENKADNPEDHFGIIHKDFTTKPAFYAYKTLTKLCPSGSTRPNLHVYGNLYVSQWKTPKGNRVWAIWNLNGKKEILFKTKGICQLFNHLGEIVYPTSSNSLVVNSGVTYIVGDRNFKILDL